MWDVKNMTTVNYFIMYHVSSNIQDHTNIISNPHRFLVMIALLSTFHITGSFVRWYRHVSGQFISRKHNNEESFSMSWHVVMCSGFYSQSKWHVYITLIRYFWCHRYVIFIGLFFCEHLWYAANSLLFITDMNEDLHVYIWTMRCLAPRNKYIQPCIELWILRCAIAQRADDVLITSLLRQNGVTASFWNNNNVIITSCVSWEGVVAVRRRFRQSKQIYRAPIQYKDDILPV